jgi:hypothetical protein
VSLRDVLDDLCRAIDTHAPGVISTVLLVDPDAKRLWLAAGPRFPAVLKAVISPWPIGPNRGSSGTAAFLKQRVFLSAVTTDPRFPDDYRNLAVSHGLRASWSEPLISKDAAVLGTFAMYYAEPRIPDKSDLELIEAAGHIALIAIQVEIPHQGLGGYMGTPPCFRYSCGELNLELLIRAEIPRIGSSALSRDTLSFASRERSQGRSAIFFHLIPPNS